MKKLHRYAITFDKWTDPVFIDAYTAINAIKRAQRLFPVCDCGCGLNTNVTIVECLK